MAATIDPINSSHPVKGREVRMPVIARESLHCQSGNAHYSVSYPVRDMAGRHVLAGRFAMALLVVKEDIRSERLEEFAFVHGSRNGNNRTSRLQPVRRAPHVLSPAAETASSVSPAFQ